MLNSQTSPCLGLPDRALDGNPVADLPIEPLGQVHAHDGGLAVAEPRGHLIGRQLVLRVELHERLGIEGDLREEVRGILVDATKPAVVRRHHHARRRAQSRLVRHGQRHDQADLVNQHQTIEPGDVHAKAEGRADRHQQAEEQKGDEDRQQRERGANPLAPQAAPQQGKEFHAATPVSRPLSRCSVRLARSAARGSWVTMMIVLP